MARQPIDRFWADVVRSLAILCNQQRRPVCLNTWYADGTNDLAGLHWPSDAGQWETAISESLRTVLARNRNRAAAPICLAVWFSDGSCAQHGFPTIEESFLPSSAELGQCKRDIIRVLEAAGQRLTTTRVLEGLAARQLLWGESTVKRILAAMVRGRELTSRRDVRPRGYGLPNWP